MRRVVSFGTYLFPATVPESGELLTADFTDGVRRSVQLAGADGAFDLDGDAPLASAVGTVRARFALVAGSAAAMAAARDALMALAGVGLARLTIETSGGQQRWTDAKIHRIHLPTTHDSASDRLSEVTVEWHVPYPRWFSTAAGSPLITTCTGAETLFTVTNGGTALTYPTLTITAVTAIGAGGVTVQRRIGATAIDSLTYGAALAVGDVLTVDARTLTVRKNGADAYATVFSALHPAWLRLPPGSSALRVSVGAGESVTLSVGWVDAWY